MTACSWKCNNIVHLNHLIKYAFCILTRCCSPLDLRTTVRPLNSVPSSVASARLKSCDDSKMGPMMERNESMMFSS